MAAKNALVAMFPDLEAMKGAPRGSKDLGDGYVLLGPKDTTLYRLLPSKRATLDIFFINHPESHHETIYRWGHLRIPTEQIARSRWKEMERCSEMARTDRNIKVRQVISFIFDRRILIIP